MVCCNAMAWTDKTVEGRLKVLVMSSYPVEGTFVVTEEQAVPGARAADRVPDDTVVIDPPGSLAAVWMPALLGNDTAFTTLYKARCARSL